MRQGVVDNTVVTGIPEIDIPLFILGFLFWFGDKIFSRYQDPDSAKGHQKVNPSERQRRQLLKCAIDHCNSLSFRNSEYCWKHQDSKGAETDGPSWWEEGGNSL